MRELSILDYWAVTNRKNPAFMLAELCDETGLTSNSANGILTFTGVPSNPLGEFLIGRTFNHLLEETNILPSPPLNDILNIPTVTASSLTL